MAKIRTGHVLQLADGDYFIEEAPYRTAVLEDAEIYYKYFDLTEAQARAKMRTGLDTTFRRVTFAITLLNETGAQ